jgi:saccharopine dehydrogenase-like NADP-dependent oxidoreductase
MRKIVLLGAGKIGDAIINLLGHTGDYALTVADRDPARIALVEKLGAPNVTTRVLDISEPASLANLLRGQDAVLSAAPYSITPVIAEAARAAGVHYLDLTEDVQSTRRVKELALGADAAFVPQCGLAPGFISTSCAT